MGLMWILGTFWIIYETYEHIFLFKSHKELYQYCLLTFTFVVGFIFLYSGKVRSTIFDKNQGTLTIKKRNIFCDKRQIITYKLKDITDVRAVYRGYKSGTIDTQEYMIIV